MLEILRTMIYEIDTLDCPITLHCVLKIPQLALVDNLLQFTL